MKLGCIVMAAGQATRFGTNKLLEDFCGKPLYRWALEAIPQDVYEVVHVVTGYAPIIELAEGLGMTAVFNSSPELGVSRTIRLGLEGMLDCDGVLFMTADQPCLTRDSVRKVAALFEADPTMIAAAGCNGKKGNPCLFPHDLLPELMTLEGDAGGSKVIKAHLERLRLTEIPALELADCDTAQLLRELEEQKNSLPN